MAYQSINILKNRLAKINHRQFVLNKEQSDLANITKSRRIKINILLDSLANEETKLINQIKIYDRNI